MNNSSFARLFRLTGGLLLVCIFFGAGCNLGNNRLTAWLGGDAGTPADDGPAVEQASLEVMLDRTFTIELASNESHGYRWTTQHSRPNIEFIKDEYIVNSRLVTPESLADDSSEPKLIAGAGGKHFFTFSAKERGYAQITFSYGLEGQTPLKQVIYDVNVK